MEYYRKVRLYGYILILGTVILVLANVATIYYYSGLQLEENLVEVAQVVSDQFKATRQFIAENQDKINYTKDGSFEFKHLNPAVVGRGVGEIFNKKNSYRIKQTRLKVRNPVNAPDNFEIKGLKKLAEDHQLKRFSGYTEDGMGKVFRFMIPLYIEKSCLLCHGDPAGEIDMAGYPKEGYRLGDLAGAISIAIPINKFALHYPQNLISEVVIAVLLTTVLLPFTIFMIIRSTRVSRELQNSLHQLMSLEQKKDELTRMIVHDLRNPLTVVKAGVCRLAEVVEKPEEAKLVKMVGKSTERVLSMINELSEVSKLEVDKYEITLVKFSLVEIINAKKTYYNRITCGGIILEFNIPDDIPEVRGDPKLVERILDNIISNAERYIPKEEGRIEVSLTHEPRSRFVQVAVKDNGTGIPHAEQKHIFEKFYQAKTTQQKARGSLGLGLAFCKLAIKKMDGDIWVESDGENGATFIFTLPLSNEISLT